MTFEQATERCWVEIDLDAVEANYDSARRLCPDGAMLLPVLKANAYGLGAAKLSRVLAEKGATLFAVADLDEALEVKSASGRDALVLGRVAPWRMAEAVEAGVVVTVYSLETAEALNAAAARVGRPARVHIKVDTGLHRLGLDPEPAAGEAEAICGMAHIRAEGLFTHLALRVREADEAQIERLLSVAGALRARGIDFGLLHACDSIGMVRYPEYHFDAVRTGAWLYGVVPSRYPNANGECRPVARLMTRVSQVRAVAKGEYLGYDEDHPLERDCVIATLCAGYADGYPRVNGVGEVEIRGRRARIAGLSCMDQMTVDVTQIPGVTPGDAVALYGGRVSLDEVAAWTHSNRNELLARIGRRVPRVYLRGGAAEEIAAGW